ncbi:MAG TPA: MFS transporter [bacterium]|jgi:MFS family permease|nr:MFS transporter [bacterium]HNZ54315.1 MFS transporter [bacterium]HOG43776.1 MFS transporter [bacterium]HPV20939.1 MFS transporter [bacterium]HPY14211.1 MFS transporter [bacterium]
MSIATLIVWILGVAGVGATGYIIWSYAKGLKESPKDMWVLFFYMVIQYVAYAAMNPIITLWLSKDCGLGDIAAGNFIMIWSILLSMVGMVAGALVDTIGIRRTMIFSVIFLFIARFFMSFITNPVIVFVVGFLPFAIGFAIVSPVVSVSIKRYTTKEGAALGFGLFYVIMNLAYAIGGWLMDFVRDKYALRDAAGKIINENAGMELLGIHFSTYQLIYVYALAMTVVSAFFIFFIRDGVEILEETDDEGKKSVKTIIKPVEHHGSGLAAVKGAYLSMFAKIKSAVVEKYFWMFIAILTTTLFVRFIFFHLHYTFPKYGIRVLGEGAKIGNIYGVLNPVLIVFLVPIVASFTKKTKSYTMLVIGSAISSLSCFLAIIPGKVFEGLTNTVLGEIIFIKWLGMADTMEKLMENPPVPEYWSLIFFFLIFTIGEAIWSPRLMQFTAEIAPKGKEGTYIALSILPFFLAKFVVGPMSGLLVNAYTPVVDKIDPATGQVMLDAAGKAMQVVGDISNHYMVWIWIGGMALVTPIGLLLFKKVFTKNIEGA